VPPDIAIFSTSPSGRYEISRYSHEAFNTCWVDTPTVTDKQTGETVLAFTNTNWSLDDAKWQGGSVVVCEMRKYPGNHEPRGLVITLECDSRQARIGGGEEVPFRGLEASMEASLQWFYATAPEPLAGLRGLLRRIFKGY
jgi:hypothetical protein